MKVDRERLFLASCIGLIATAMSFAIRGDIMGELQTTFVEPSVTAAAGAGQEQETAQAELIKTRLGLIGSVAFLSFAGLIVFGGPLVDLLGMGFLLRFAAACHIVGTILTIVAPNYWAVVLAMFIVGAGNGLVEAVCNPLIATIYPEEKTRRLTLFHAWFPGGIVIGGLLAYAFSKLGLNWQVKTALLLIPSVTYAYMIAGVYFPPTERVASGISFGAMIAAAFKESLFVVLFFMMFLTAATELGPGGWIANIYQDVMGGQEGILLLVWGSGLMYILRQFFSKQAHSISPILLITITTPLAALGLFMFRFATTPLVFFIAATLLYVGVCFWWPTMLGIAAERCPRTGAFGLALLGGAGAFSTFLAGPIMGAISDKYGPIGSLQAWALLPVVLFVVFLILHLRDQAAGGYQAQVVRLTGDTESKGH